MRNKIYLQNWLKLYKTTERIARSSPQNFVRLSEKTFNNGIYESPKCLLMSHLKISPQMLSIIIYSNIQSIDKYCQSRKPILPKMSNIRSEKRPTAAPAQFQTHHTT